MPCSWTPSVPSPTVWVFVSRRDATLHRTARLRTRRWAVARPALLAGRHCITKETTGHDGTPGSASGLSPPELQQLQQLQLGLKQVVLGAVNPRRRSHSMRDAMSRTQPTSDNANRERGAQREAEITLAECRLGQLSQLSAMRSERHCIIKPATGPSQHPFSRRRGSDRLAGDRMRRHAMRTGWIP